MASLEANIIRDRLTSHYEMYPRPKIRGIKTKPCFHLKGKKGLLGAKGNTCRMGVGAARSMSFLEWAPVMVKQSVVEYYKLVVSDIGL